MCQPDEVFRSTMILLVPQEEYIQTEPGDAVMSMVFKTRKSGSVDELFKWGTIRAVHSLAYSAERAGTVVG